MTLNQLNKLFKAQNPTGDIYHDTQTTYNVYYVAEGKTYKYKAKNLIELGLKLKLISAEDTPEAKVRAERKAKAIQEEKELTERIAAGNFDKSFFEEGFFD